MRVLLYFNVPLNCMGSVMISVLALSDKVYQLLAHGRWFSLGILASSTTKAGRHDIGEILQNVALNTKNHHINQSP